MTECYEIDDLKRKVEDAKMKLLTEMKVNILMTFSYCLCSFLIYLQLLQLRKQAATELRALKAELAQKKSQSSLHGL